MSPLTISVISAVTALIASILGPIVTLTVARRQFNANVLSSNRQKWIDSFRDRLPEFIALMTSVSILKVRSRCGTEEGKRARDTDSSIAEIAERIILAYAQLSLLVKDDDDTHRQLLQLARAGLDTLRAEDTTGNDMERQIVELTHVGRSIIRAEWARVKRGT
jgi:hypothetical protein